MGLANSFDPGIMKLVTPLPAIAQGWTSRVERRRKLSREADSVKSRLKFVCRGVPHEEEKNLSVSEESGRGALDHKKSGHRASPTIKTRSLVDTCEKGGPKDEGGARSFGG